MAVNLITLAAMRIALLIGSVLAVVMTAGFVAQGLIAAAVAAVWGGSLLFLLAFRPYDATWASRFRFTLSDLILLTTLAALSLGVLYYQKPISEWIRSRIPASQPR